MEDIKMSYNNHRGGGGNLSNLSPSDLSQTKKQKSRPTNSRILALLFAGIFSIAFVVMAVVMVLDFTRSNGDASPHTGSGSLFDIGGRIDSNIASNILTAAAANNRNMEFRLFPDVFDQSSTAERFDRTLALSRFNYRIMHSDATYITFWATSTHNQTVSAVTNTHVLNAFNVMADSIANLRNHVPASYPAWLPTWSNLTSGVVGGGLPNQNWNTTQAERSNTGAFALGDGGQVNNNGEFVSAAGSTAMRPAVRIRRSSLLPPPSQQQHTITFNLQGGTLHNSTANFTRTVVSGQPIQPPTNPVRAGHTFLHWSTATTQGVGNLNVFDFGRGVTANTDLHAIWQPLTTITPVARVLTMHRGNALLGVSLTNTTVNINQDQQVTIGSATIPVPTSAGRIFLGWANSYARANSQIVDHAVGSTFAMPHLNITLFAVWQDANAQFAPRGGEVGGLVHLNGVGGSTSEFQNTWFYNPLDNATMELPTTTYMNGIFRENNPDFMSRTFDGWVMQVTHMTGTILANQRFTRIPQYTNNALTAGEVEFFARWV